SLSVVIRGYVILSHQCCRGRACILHHQQSFPTRRSSDLAIEQHSRDQFDPSVTWQDVDWLRQQTGLPLVVKGILTAEDALDHQRSEEHTSELQSRENLVCRLLLEKKTTTWSK